MGPSVDTCHLVLKVVVVSFSVLLPNAQGEDYRDPPESVLSGFGRCEVDAACDHGFETKPRLDIKLENENLRKTMTISMPCRPPLYMGMIISSNAAAIPKNLIVSFYHSTMEVRDRRRLRQTDRRIDRYRGRDKVEKEQAHERESAPQAVQNICQYTNYKLHL